MDAMQESKEWIRGSNSDLEVRSRSKLSGGVTLGSVHPSLSLNWVLAAEASQLSPDVPHPIWDCEEEEGPSTPPGSPRGELAQRTLARSPSQQSGSVASSGTTASTTTGGSSITGDLTPRKRPNGTKAASKAQSKDKVKCKSNGAESALACPFQEAKLLVSRTSDAHLREESLIMYDWDDTIAPTTWLQNVVMASEDFSVFSEALAEHTRLITEVLLASHAVSRVCIVTLCTERWLRLNFDHFFIGIRDLLVRLGIKVVHCHYDEISAASLVESKRVAMRECLAEYYPDTSVRRNVLSIGDKHIEREALITLGDEASIFKTVKFREKPTHSHVEAQLKLLTPLLPELVAEKSDFDRTFEGISLKALPKLRPAYVRASSRLGLSALTPQPAV